MFSDLLKKLEQEKRIKKQKAGIIQVEKLLKESLADLDEAKKVSVVSKKGTYLFAYTAMLKAGRALMLLNGYVPDDGAQHKTVVEVAGALMGEEFGSLIRKFEVMRRKRNALMYEAGVLLSETEAQSALTDARSLVNGMLEMAKSQNPQLELKFELDEE